MKKLLLTKRPNLQTRKLRAIEMLSDCESLVQGKSSSYPRDSWRFYPDGFDALARWACFNLISVVTDLEVTAPSGGSEIFGDTVGAFVKPIAWKPAQRIFHWINTKVANRRAEVQPCG